MGGTARAPTPAEGAHLSAASANPSLLRVEDDRPMRSCSSLTRIRTSTAVRTLASFSETTHAIASIAQTPAARSSPKRASIFGLRLSPPVLLPASSRPPVPSYLPPVPLVLLPPLSSLPLAWPRALGSLPRLFRSRRLFCLCPPSLRRCGSFFCASDHQFSRHRRQRRRTR